jgi:hypothetical protein
MDWMCFIVGLAPIWIPLAVLVILPPLLRWDDRRRQRAKDRSGFEVKLTESSSVTAKKENDHG